MSSIRLANNMGDVYYHAATDTVYHLLANQPSDGAVDAAAGTGDEINIQGQDFSYDNTAPLSSSWTACQLGVITHDETYKADTPLGAAYVGTYRTLFTAPSDGDVRVFGSSSLSNGGLYVNGIYVKYLPNDRESLKYSVGLRLLQGDVLSLGAKYNGGPIQYDQDGETVYSRFCPDVYP